MKGSTGWVLRPMSLFLTWTQLGGDHNLPGAEAQRETCPTGVMADSTAMSLGALEK